MTTVAEVAGDTDQDKVHVVLDVEVPFEHFMLEMNDIRDLFNQHDVKEQVTISFKATGYPAHGDFTCHIRVSISYKDEWSVEGRNLLGLAHEVLRRYEYSKYNKPLLLKSS